MPLRTALADSRLIAALLTLAEREALALGDATPAAEHLLLAAVSLPDESASAALQRGPQEVRSALLAVHAAALAAVGIAEPEGLEAPAEASRLYTTTASAQDVFQRARVLAKTSQLGLRTAHVLLAALELKHGTVTRVFTELGVDRDAVAGRARQAVDA